MTGADPPPERPATDPVQLADEINRALADTASSPELMEAAGRLEQLAARVMRERPGLMPPTLAALTPDARLSMEIGIEAAESLSATVPAQKRLPDWKIVAAPPAETLLKYYRSAESGYPSDGYVRAIKLYVRHMRRDDRAYYGYYNWQVLYKYVKGTMLLPAGYPAVRAQRIE